MSAADLDPIAGRIGRLDCVCAPGDERGSRGGEGLARLAAGFGLAILAQTLVLAALPLAAASSAPRPALAGLPYAIALLGAALATFPASYLLDAFGRRAAFALGASLGVAGGFLAGWAALHRQFPILCIGALWLGLAHGFALFYRHAAATSAAGPRAERSFLQAARLPPCWRRRRCNSPDRWPGRSSTPRRWSALESPTSPASSSP